MYNTYMVVNGLRWNDVLGRICQFFFPCLADALPKRIFSKKKPYMVNLQSGPIYNDSENKGNIFARLFILWIERLARISQRSTTI